jgi:FdhD protein
MHHAPVAIESVLKIRGASAAAEDDLLAVEQPLAIRIGYGPAGERIQRELAVTMRTPGHDHDLVLGFLFTEGIISTAAQVNSLRHCEQGPEAQRGNVVRVELHESVSPSPVLLKRQTFVSSSCGICGKTSIEAVRVLCTTPPSVPEWTLSADQLLELNAAVVARQSAFSATGGMHAAALFDLAGNLLALREDVGRHNALDKLVGHALAEQRVPLSRHLLFLSGRASFELIQKAAMAGISLVCAVGAPSSLAVEAAREFQMTLAGFLREGRFNLYTGPERVRLHSPAPAL